MKRNTTYLRNRVKKLENRQLIDVVRQDVVLMKRIKAMLWLCTYKME